MAFFWEDKTFFDRLRYGDNMLLKVHLPIIILLSIIIFFFFKDIISIKHIFFLALSLEIFIFTFLDIFLQKPHVKIPDTESKTLKTSMYILVFIFATFFLYFVWVGILQNYISFLKNLICCNVMNKW